MLIQVDTSPNPDCEGRESHELKFYTSHNSQLTTNGKQQPETTNIYYTRT